MVAVRAHPLKLATPEEIEALVHPSRDPEVPPASDIDTVPVEIPVSRLP